MFSLATGDTNAKEALPVAIVCAAVAPSADADITSLPAFEGVYLNVAVPVASVRTEDGIGLPKLELNETVAPETVFPPASFTPMVKFVGVPIMADDAPLKVTVVPDTNLSH
jgi:hypothetical protein